PSEVKEHPMPRAAGPAPALLSDECRLGVIVGAYRKREAQSIGNQAVQAQPFQEGELPWQDPDARRPCVDNALASYSGRREARAREYLLAEFRQQSAETPLERRQILRIAGGAFECAYLTDIVYQRCFDGRAADVYACNPLLAAHIFSVSGGTSRKQSTTERLATDLKHSMFLKPRMSCSSVVPCRLGAPSLYSSPAKLRIRLSHANV